MNASAPTLRLRAAGPSDHASLVALNALAYPDLVEEGVVFDRAQIAAHHGIFPEGQIVATDGDTIVGAIATLIVPGARALGQHTWNEATGRGTFATHDPRGDTLYLADIYADPARRGVGPALYQALFDLCRRKTLARVVGGGRLWGYHEVADAMTPEAYVEEVEAGVRRDRVLGSQLRAGFSVRGILRPYLDDWRSAGAASLIVWDNPAATKAPVANAPGAPPRWGSAFPPSIVREVSRG